MTVQEFVPNGLLKGLAIKTFILDYASTKAELYRNLCDLVSQINLQIFHRSVENLRLSGIIQIIQSMFGSC